MEMKVDEEMEIKKRQQHKSKCVPCNEQESTWMKIYELLSVPAKTEICALRMK